MNDDIHTLSGAYVLDALDDDERARFRAHLDACASCRQEVDELRAAVEPLAAAVAEPPPARLRAATLAAIDQVRPLPPLTRPAAAAADDADRSVTAAGPARRPDRGRRHDAARSRRPAVLLAAAAVVLVVVGAVVALGPWRDGSTPEPTVASVLDADDARELRQQLDGFSATLVVSEDADAAVIVSDDMPPAPTGHAYQLWYDRPGQGMVPAGLMPPSDDGQRVLLDGDLDDATAVGVTVEPTGGSEAPTTDPVVVFSLT